MSTPAPNAITTPSTRCPIDQRIATTAPRTSDDAAISPVRNASSTCAAPPLSTEPELLHARDRLASARHAELPIDRPEGRLGGGDRGVEAGRDLGARERRRQVGDDLELAVAQAEPGWSDRLGRRRRL